MIAHWMLYCAAVGTLLSLGALALERALAACGRATRWAWLAALVATLAVPAAARLLPRAPAPAPAAAPVLARTADPAADALPLRAPTPPRFDAASLDGPLLAFWGGASAAALLLLAGMGIALARRRRGWRAAEVGGVPVLVSADTGPAVVGLLRSRIVLPEWACAAEDSVRALMLEHESEHVRARDPQLLAAALLAVAAMPWNPAVWWQLRRLRLALEVDCDARVLRRRADVRAYGALLLEVGRRAARSRLAAAAFSEPASLLERRIRIMTTPPVRSPWLRAAGFGALALALGVAACETPGPVQVAPVEAERLYAAEGAPEGLQPAQITPRQALERYYPDVLTRGIGAAGGTAIFVLSPQGTVTAHDLERRTPAEAQAIARGERRVRGPLLKDVEPRIDPERIQTVDVMKFRSGEMGPDPVDVVWVRTGDPGSVAAQGGTRFRASGDGVGEQRLRTVQTRGEGPEPVDPQQFARLVAANVPAVVRRGDVDGQVAVRFTVAEGRARGAAVQGSPHPDVAAAALRVVEGLTFTREWNAGRPEQEVRVSINFNTPPLVGGGVERTAARGEARIPAAPASLIAGTLRAHYPEVAEGRGGGDYWFVIDARGRVADTGKGDDGGRLNAIPLDRVAGVQVEQVEVGGHTASVLWLRLKS